MLKRFDPHWLNGTKATMDGVQKTLHEDPHVLDVDGTHGGTRGSGEGGVVSRVG